MTKEEAVAIREKQLSGKPVSPFLAAQALKVIADGEKKVTPALRGGCLPEQLLRLLVGGPMERGDFNSVVGPTKRSSEAIMRLRDRGYIKCEWRLTEEGLRALGLEGPK